MQYAEMAKAQQAGIYGGAAQNLAGAAVGAINAPAPRTISSAASRVDLANERLASVRDRLNEIAGNLGALHPIPGNGENKLQTSPIGAVGRLNESADRSHYLIGEIDSLLAGIANALG